jgi:hypothetical protein
MSSHDSTVGDETTAIIDSTDNSNSESTSQLDGSIGSRSEKDETSSQNTEEEEEEDDTEFGPRRMTKKWLLNFLSKDFK